MLQPLLTKYFRRSMSFLEIGYFVFFLVAALGQLQRIELLGLPAFYFHEVLLSVFVGWHVVNLDWRVFVMRILKKVPTVGRVGLGWVGAGLIIALFSHTPILTPLLYLIRLGLYLLSGLSLLFDLKKNKINQQFLSLCLLTFFSLITYFGLLQYIFVPDTRFLFFLGWDDHYYRLISTLFDPGFTGIILCLGFIFSQLHIAEYISHQRKKHLFTHTTFCLWLLSISSVVAILLTYSRASYIAFIFSTICLLQKNWRANRQLFITNLCMLFFFILAIPFLPKPGGEGVNLARTSTIESRISVTQTAFASMNKPIDFLFGKGIFTQPAQLSSSPTEHSQHARLPDNWLILLFTGTGIGGTVIAATILSHLLQRKFLWQKYLWIGILAVFIHGLFNATVTYPFVLIVLGTWTAITLEN
jgi:hypothetical protein